MPIQSYRDLEVWRKAIELTVECYRVTERFPRAERFGLTAQARRAASSIPANIAEGHGRFHTGDYLRSRSYSRGSVKELETHLIIGHRLDYLSGLELETLLGESDHVSRMITSLRRKLGG